MYIVCTSNYIHALSFLSNSNTIKIRCYQSISGCVCAEVCVVFSNVLKFTETTNTSISQRNVVNQLIKLIVINK